MSDARPVTLARVALLTSVAVTAFAANSILCRLALAKGDIDPASFTGVRLASGAVTLALIVLAQKGKPVEKGDWTSGFLLFAYAIAFSLAYIGLTAGTGALLLFGSVQATMLIVSLTDGHRPKPNEWLGLALALGGLLYLVSPGLAAPPLLRALLMIAAGVAWGFYSLKGRGVSEPVKATAGNFLRATPLALVPILLSTPSLYVSQSGILWAVLSGAVTSGLGYVIWYAALPHLGGVRAAIVQLTVPIIAAVGGILLLGELLTSRLLVAGLVTLGGVALAMKRGNAPGKR
jgi:drug/metabolite transporter (DMT)-like permease